MKKTIVLLLLFSILQLLLINIVSAGVGDGGVNLRIINNKLYITDYYEGFPNVNTTGNNISFTGFSYDLGSQIVCNLTVNGTIYNSTSPDVSITNTATYQTGCYLSLDYTKAIPLKNEYVLYLRNVTQTCNYTIIAVDEGSIYNYTQCLTDKATCEANHNILSATCFQSNITNVEYVTCSSNYAVCQNEKVTLQTSIDALNKAAEDGKNTKWVYAVIALVIGILGYKYYTGTLGGPKVKKPEDSYQRGQSA